MICFLLNLYISLSFQNFDKFVIFSDENDIPIFDKKAQI